MYGKFSTAPSLNKIDCRRIYLCLASSDYSCTMALKIAFRATKMHIVIPFTTK